MTTCISTSLSRLETCKRLVSVSSRSRPATSRVHPCLFYFHSLSPSLPFFYDLSIPLFSPSLPHLFSRAHKAATLAIYSYRLLTLLKVFGFRSYLRTSWTYMKVKIYTVGLQCVSLAAKVYSTRDVRSFGLYLTTGTKWRRSLPASSQNNKNNDFFSTTKVNCDVLLLNFPIPWPFYSCVL